MHCIVTSRLDLIPATVPLLDAELESHSGLASLLDASIPEGWPPGEYDRPAVEYFRARSAENAEAVGWYGWYALLRSRDEGLRILIGAGGFHGPPTSDGLLEIGYSVLPAFEGQGYATELVRALVGYAFATERVRRVIAHTNAENAGSIKVLERAGFHFVGHGQESGSVEYVQLNPSASPAA